jgi:catechol 2,3-dioxygenase-like lactoylglutathione lyase family enzyme
VIASLEVVTLPVSDVDKSLDFYRTSSDSPSTSTTRRRMTSASSSSPPRGQARQYNFGVGLTDASPGSGQGLYLVVTDSAAVRDELVDRGVGVSSIRRKDVDGGQWRGRFRLGADPHRGDYASFADFTDPDGNAWMIQERGHSEAN